MPGGPEEVFGSSDRKGVILIVQAAAPEYEATATSIPHETGAGKVWVQDKP